MKFVVLIALCLIVGCASLGGIAPSERTFNAPIARVKPAFISTFASMGMMISAIDVRAGREVIKASKAGSEVEIELEALGRTSTRARVSARTGGLLYDEAAATSVMRQAEKLLGGT